MPNLNLGDVIKPVRNLAGGSIPTLTMPEKASMTWRVGEVIQCTGGYAKLATTGGIASDALGVTCTTGTNSSGDGGGNVLFTPCYNWIVFEGTVFSTGTPSTTTLDRADLFASYQLKRCTGDYGTTGVWYINKASGGAYQVQIIGLKDGTGTYNGRAYFIFGYAGRQYCWL